MEAYCFKCKTKREIKDTVPVFTKKNSPGTRGVCTFCNSSIFKMGKTDAHKDIPQPDKKSEIISIRSGKLVIVESPAKARTISRILGKEFVLKASVGHVRDLYKSKISIDVDGDFQPSYIVPRESKKVVKELKELGSRAEVIYLATDPDREGEAIAWHIQESAGIPLELTRRVVFHEITKNAVEKAFANPRELNVDLIDAQQARRVLDRIVGYKLSPFLWKKVRKRGLSAGRVQSVALRLIVEREREIQNFNPVEYWELKAVFLPEGLTETLEAKLVKINNTKPKLGTAEDVKPIIDDLESTKYRIDSIVKGVNKRRPSPPFTTSTLQQVASQWFGFSARKTMMIAQQLYEGLPSVKAINEGLITYIRTDSTTISKSAQESARGWIKAQYGADYIPEKAPFYKTKSRGAQEAHEAIRPTSVPRTPESLKKYMKPDQFRLYRLIWNRFVASQMNPAVYDTVKVNILGKSTSNKYLFSTLGSKIRFKGYTVVYSSPKKSNDLNNNEESIIPEGLTKDQLLKLKEINPEQLFTQPPPRYSDGSLVKAMEENGIGRPSTYAQIIKRITDKSYVQREKRRFIPTEIGMIVNDLLLEHFENVINLDFTAKMEEELDQIAGGKTNYLNVIKEFYGPFIEQVKAADKNAERIIIEPIKVGRSCPDCGKDLVIKSGRYGDFIGCSGYPECRHIEKIIKKIGVICPEDGGEIIERKTRRGKIFYGCQNYPKCEFASWKKPVKDPCPECGGLRVLDRGKKTVCTVCHKKFPE